jgi:transcriptional regulator with XRE-family HTH domain
MRKPVPPTGLCAVRLMKGWRRGALADAVGLAPCSLYRIETGKTKQPKLATRRALTKVLGVAESKLF